MTRSQREIVNRMVEALLDVLPESREAALDTLCSGLAPSDDVDTIREEVRRLLAEDSALPARLASLSQSTALIATQTRKGVARHAADGAELEHVPPIVGRYHLRAPLGTGGMGQVFLADQRAPIRRTVAVKLIRWGFDSHDVLARFEAERQALARMDHPNIARVLDAGVIDSGRPYFVMEYVNGKPITQFADEERLDLHERLELFLQICDAVAHAHTKGVIHRDLKPSNVLAYRAEDGKPVVKVIDFGIAKAVSGGRGGDFTKTAHQTDYGVVIGTYEYMSPEQAAMSSDIDTRADVYSLGVMLYELLAGSRPFERRGDSRESDEELRRQIREVDPPRPSSRVRGLSRATSASRFLPEEAARQADSPESIAAWRQCETKVLVRTLQRELEWIPLKALRKDRQRRYSGPAELAQDIRNYLQARPLLAAPESKLYLARKLIVRHRASIAAAASLLLLLIAGIVGTTLGLVREQAARQLADENGRKATWSAYRSAIVAAEVALQNADAIRLRRAIEAAPAELRGWEWENIAYESKTYSARLNRTEADHFVTSVALAGNQLGLSSTGAADGFTVLWELKTGRVLRREPGGQCAVDPNGKLYAIVRPDGTLEVCDVLTGSILKRIPVTNVDQRPWHICENSFSLDGVFVAAWDGSDDAIHILDLRTGEARVVKTSAQISRIMGFLSLDDGFDSSRVFFGSRSTMGHIYFDLERNVVEKDSRFTVVVGRRGLINGATWDWTPVTAGGSASPVFDLPRGSLATWRTLYMPSRALIAFGRDDGSVEVVPPRLGTDVRTVRSASAVEHQTPRRIVVGSAPVNALTFTPDEANLIVTLRSGEVLVVPLEPPAAVEIQMPGVWSTVLSPDNQRILGLGWGDVQCVDVLTGLPLWGRNLGPNMNTHAAWSPDGSRVVITTDPAAATPGPSDVFVLDAQTGEQISAWSASAVTPDNTRPIAAPPWAVDIAGLRFNADGTELFVAHSGGAVERVDAASFESRSARFESETRARDRDTEFIRLEYPKHGEFVPSPRGSRLAQLSIVREGNVVRNGPVLIRDANTGTELARVEVAGYAATALAWRRDGKAVFVALANQDGCSLSQIDVETGKELHRFGVSSGTITALALSPKEDRLVAYTNDRRTMVFDTETGTEIVSSFVPEVVINAFFTAENALVTSGNGVLIKRRETQATPASPDRAAPAWPTTLQGPPGIEEARRHITRAHRLLLAYYDSGLPWEAFLSANGVSEDEGNLLASLRERRPPSINLLNSSALSRLLSTSRGSDDLSRAEWMLRQAIQIKPHSSSLQANYGNVLFQQEKFAECLEPLLQSEKLSLSKGAPPSPITLLKLAIAAAEVGDASASEHFASAMREIKPEDADQHPEIAPLLERARARLSE